MRLKGTVGWFRYGLPGLVLGLGLSWGLEGSGPSALAQGQPAAATPGFPPPAVERPRAATAPAGESSGTVAFTSPAGGNAQFLYLIDTRAHALAIYRVDPSNPKGTVKLEAARQYQWDLRLAEYNNLPPEVAAIESTVKSLGPPNR